MQTWDVRSLDVEPHSPKVLHSNDEGRTIVMVTHEPDIGQHCKRIVHIKDGQVLEDDPVHYRLRARDVLAEMAAERERD